MQCIYLPPVILKKLSLVPGTVTVFRIGTLQSAVKVLPLSSNPVSESTIYVSPDLSASCEIPAGLTVTMKYDKSVNCLFVGPLVGLFTVRNILPDSEYGSQELVLAALANSSADIGGLVFVFCPEDVNWDMLKVKGSVYCQSTDGDTGSWVQINLPLPDVIYDRIPSRTIAARPEVEEAKSKLINMGLKFFNPMFLNKWETHVALTNIPEVAEYLPPTKMVENPEDIKQFLDIYKSVFLKPSSGSLGKRIIKITAADSCYSYVYRSREKQTVQSTVTEFNMLMDQLKPVMGKRSYIVQKDLDLARFENCTFDIRVLAQKDMFGNWRRTKIYVRAAAADSFLANLSDGARPKPINTVLQEVFHTSFSDKEGLGEDIRLAIRKLPPALEAATEMVWGELGIDLGIDNAGRIWLIEINSKPFRTLVSNSGSINVIRRSLLRPLEFAKFLAGFYRHSQIDAHHPAFP